MALKPCSLRNILTLIVFFLCLPFSFAQQLEVKLVALTSPISPGNIVTMTLQTAANATCLITVQYMSGASTATLKRPGTSDSHGLLTLGWPVGTNANPGTWPITTTCSLGARQGALTTSFVVR
jgi:hypothetical protein